MRCTLPVVFIALLALTACDRGQEGKPVTVIEFGEDGTTTRRAEPSAAPARAAAGACEQVVFEQIPLVHCVADPARHRIRVDLGPSGGGAPYRSFAKLAEARGADAPPVAFAMNAGMFDGEGKPIGYYVEGGERLKQLNRNDGEGNFHLKPNGVFFGTGTRWRVMTAERFYADIGDRPEFGTQSGPMLLIDGKVHPEITADGPSRTTRNAVGVDAQGRAHFVIADGPISFGRLARYFRDELKTANALYLDGSVSALWNPASGRMDDGTLIGPMVIVEDMAEGRAP